MVNITGIIYNVKMKIGGIYLMKRLTGLDFTKAVAIFSVIGVHFFYNTKFYSVPITGNNMYLQVFIRWLFIICVPLFIILTGYLQSEKEPTKSYFKKIIPIVVIYLIYSALAIFYRINVIHEVQGIREWIYSIMKFSADGYSWYVNMYFGLFLLSPFLNLIYKNLKTKKDKLILIFILISITGIPHLMISLGNGIPEFKIINISDWWMSIWPITYYFIGLFIKEYQIKIRKLISLTMMIIIVLIETAITIILSGGRVYTDFIGDYPSILVMIQAVFLFLAIYNIDIKSKIIYKPLGLIAALTLDIYLATYITDKIVYGYFYKRYFVSQQETLFYILPLVLATFTMAFVISVVRKYTIRIR